MKPQTNESFSKGLFKVIYVNVDVLNVFGN